MNTTIITTTLQKTTEGIPTSQSPIPTLQQEKEAKTTITPIHQEEETQTTDANLKTTISRTPPQSIQSQHNLQPNHQFNNTKLQTTIRFLLRPQHSHMEKHQNNTCQHKQNRLLQSSKQQHLPQPMHTH